MTDRHKIKGIANNAQQCYANSVIQLIFSSTRLLEIIDKNNSNTLMKRILMSYQKDSCDVLSKVIGNAATEFIKSEKNTFNIQNNQKEEIKQLEKINNQLSKNAKQALQTKDQELEEAIRLSKLDSDFEKAIAESKEIYLSTDERGLGNQDEAVPFMRYLLSYYCNNFTDLQHITCDTISYTLQDKNVSYDTYHLMSDIQIPYTFKDESKRDNEDYKLQMETILSEYKTDIPDYKRDIARNQKKVTHVTEPSCVYVFTSPVGMNFAPYYLDVKVEFNGGIKYLQYIFRGGVVYDGFSNVGSNGISGRSGGHYYTTKVTNNGYYKLSDSSIPKLADSATVDINRVLHYKPGTDVNSKFILVLYECVRTYGLKDEIAAKRKIIPNLITAK